MSKKEFMCPDRKEKAVHSLEYVKATCTRVPDILRHFQCSLDGSCKKCEEDYRE